MVPHHGEQWAEVVGLEAADARLLKRRAGTSFLRSRRLTRDRDERIIEYVVSLAGPGLFCTTPGILMSSSLLLNHPTLADRARGAFYGLALGDAFGMPTQSLSRERIVEQFGRIDKLENAFPDQPIAPGLRAGSITDDTEQAVLVAHLLADGHGKIEPMAFAHALIEWKRR